MADTLTKRNYVPLATVQATTAAADLNDIDLAEQLIDQYVGFPNKHVPVEYQGQVSALGNSNKTIIDTNDDSQLEVNDNYFKFCVIEFITGACAGEVKAITSSDKDDKSVTVTDAFTGTPVVGDVFKVYQLGKFPRQKDATVAPSADTFYKTIPQNVRDAVVAQVAYQAQMGDAFFAGDDSDKESESIGNYSYSRGGGGGSSSSVKFLAPRARILLRGFKNLTGRLVV